MSQSPSTTTRGTEQKRTDGQLPTREFDVPSVTDLFRLSEGDKIELDCKPTPLTVKTGGVRQVSLISGAVQQYAIAAEHNRTDAIEHEFYEAINVADGQVIEIVDERGVPIRILEVDA